MVYENMCRLGDEGTLHDFFHVYNVGQGLCTVLEGQTEEGNGYFSIFDCGTICQGSVPINTIEDKIVKLAQDRGRIDNIVISHQDKDHWSMLENLIWKYYDVPECVANEKSIIKKKEYCFQHTPTDTRLYRVLGNNKIGARIESINVSNNTVSSKCAKVVVDRNNDVDQFELYMCKSQSTKEINLWMWKNAGRMEIAVMINNVNIHGGAYEVELDEGNLNINQWDCMDKKIPRETILQEADKVGEKKIIRWSDFKKYLEKFLNYGDLEPQRTFDYSFMEKKVAGETNFNEKYKPIGSVLLGGSYWQKEYTKLYTQLKILVDLGLIDSVNGYRKNAGNMESGEISGLLRIDETKPVDGFQSSKFAIDQKLIADQPEIYRNATSLIVEFMVQEGRRFLFPGDATVHAFDELAASLENSSDDCRTFLIAPHHGSVQTNYYDPKDLKGGQPLIGLLETLKTDKGRKIDTCVISAYSGKFGHPGKRFVDDVAKYVEDIEAGKKRAICYVEGEKPQKNPIIDKENTKRIECTQMFGKDGKVVWERGVRQEEEEPEEPKAGSARRPPKDAFVR